MNHIFKLNRTGSLYPKTYWELLPKEILGAITQRDTGSYYPKRYWELLPKEILGAITQRDTGMSYGKMEAGKFSISIWKKAASSRNLGYGYIKNHKKTVKNGQTRTREMEEYKRAKDSKPKTSTNVTSMDCQLGNQCEFVSNPRAMDCSPMIDRKKG
ncbi:hypothetical protein Tco_0955060 [Tanacetum coccineum]|uniref:Uncharacterized protein n=1 Tax=Tanacetum coccineum TaxID=301880 RepID=A0ABQ5E656_9ASTR